MEFTLTYDGPLATNGPPKKKHAIREALHPQLKELWELEPLVRIHNAVEPGGNQLANVGGHDFASIVHPNLHLRAKLDILMLRPEPAGKLVSAGGDIDNRLKTLFDALTCPTQAQDIPATWTPGMDQRPLHCLLKDDSLITAVNVDTARLLAPQEPTWVKLVIRIHVYAAQSTWGSQLIL